MADIVTLADAETALRLNLTAGSVDEQILQWCITGATSVIESITGPTTANTYTEFYDGGQPFVFPLHQPLVSVTSVTEYIGTATYDLTEQPLGSQTNSWGYTVNLLDGTIERRTIGGGAANFMPGESNVKVVYSAGFATIPGNVMLAAFALIRHMYTYFLPRFKGSRDNWDDGSTVVQMGYAVPNFVTEMLAPSRRGPGIA